ncbi:MAG: ABC-type multidrug transport system permease component [Candidatus Doudnabacteria bacterium]|nr:ABC-type multidrug transport system permease component [Candidatus Doudnabacteria bacterium]
MSFYHLFITNIRLLYRNWRGLFFNLFLPIVLYVAISKVAGNGSGSSNYADFLLPGIIAMTIMQTGIFSLAYYLVDLKSRGVLKRFFVTPLSTAELTGSLILSRLVLMAIQIAILVGIGKIYFGAHVNGSVLAIILLMVLGGGVFLGLGFLISSLANTYDEAAPMTTLLNLIFTFLGNIFFPSSVLPKAFQAIGSKLPVTYLAEGMRHNFIEQWSLKQTLPDFLGLAIWLVIILAATTYTFRLKKE